VPLWHGVLFTALRYVRNAFADKIGHYGFRVVAIIIVNGKVKNDLMAGTPAVNVYAIGSGICFDKGLNSCPLESGCEPADEWGLPRTKTMQFRTRWRGCVR
jgi:hypothetical protein